MTRRTKPLTVSAAYHERRVRQLENRARIAEHQLAQIIKHGDVIGHGDIPTGNRGPRFGEAIGFEISASQPSVFLLLPVPAVWFDELAVWAADQEDWEEDDREPDIIDHEAHRPQKEAMIRRLRERRAAA